MHIHCLPLGDYQTNCYLIFGENSATCAVIDPGYHAEKVLQYAVSHGKTIETILLTHGHFDHVGAVRDLAAATGCRVYLCEKELALPPMMTAGSLYYTDAYDDGDLITTADLTLQVIETPGHTPGSVCLLCEDALFSGDTLFAGSCGRTDFPGSNPGDMVRSLQRLSLLPGDFRVFPGHAEETTLQQERQYNPFMK